MEYYCVMFYLAALLRKLINTADCTSCGFNLTLFCKRQQFTVFNTIYPRNELMDSEILAVATITVSPGIDLGYSHLPQSK